MVVQGTLTVNDTTLFGQAGTLTNDGVVNMEGASPVMVQQGQTTWSFDNKGTLNSSSTGTATIQAPITNESSGTVLVNSGELLLSSSSPTNSGTVTVGNGSATASLVVTRQYLQSAGVTTVALSSTLTAGSGVAIVGGTLSGAGMVTSPVTTSGTGTAQNVSVQGPLNLTSGLSGSGSVATEVTSASEYDQIAITGTASLTGSTLDLSTANGYQPPNGTSFVILTCSVSCVGPFGKVVQSAMPDGAIYTVGYTGTTVTLTVGGGSAGKPTTTVVAPSNGATLSNTYTLDAGASNATSVEFWLLYGSYGSTGHLVGKATPTIYGWLFSWTTTTVPNGSYLLLSEAFGSGGSAFSSPLVITVNNAPPPTTSVVLPSSGAKLKGSTTLDAAASNATSVQFELTGGKYGSSPHIIGSATPTIYGWLLTWSTPTVPNGSYVLMSEASGPGGSALSLGVTIKVKN